MEVGEVIGRYRNRQGWREGEFGKEAGGQICRVLRRDRGSKGKTDLFKLHLV